jgi:hypothetical protein
VFKAVAALGFNLFYVKNALNGLTAYLYNYKNLHDENGYLAEKN